MENILCKHYLGIKDKKVLRKKKELPSNKEQWKIWLEIKYMTVKIKNQ